MSQNKKALRNPVYPLLTRGEWMELLHANHKNMIEYRHQIVMDTGYTIVTDRILNELITFIGDMPVLEVGAGKGYLTRLLKDRKIDIEAIDSRKGANTRDWWNDPLFFDVKEATVEETNFSAYQVILMTWPCMDDNYVLTVLDKMEPGQFLIYYGESKGGCSATSGFFDRLASVEFEPIEHETLDDATVSFFPLTNEFWSLYVKA